MQNTKRSLGIAACIVLALIPLHATHAEDLLSRLTPLAPPKPLTIASFFPTIDHASIERSLSSSLLLNLIADLTKSCSLAATSSASISPTQPAPVMTFSLNEFSHWQIASGFNEGTAWNAYINPTNAQGAGLSADPFDTGLPSTAPIEALLANTDGKYLNDSCPSMTYTGDPSVDLACYINEAKAQGYVYVIGQHAALPSS